MTPEAKLYAAIWQFLAAKVAPYLPPRRPQPFTFTLTQELTSVALKFKLTAQIPPPVLPEDVLIREMTTTKNGVADAPVEFEPAATSFVIGLFDAGDEVSASLVDVDASGNRSEPTVESITVSDTVPPPAPGAFGFGVEQVTV